MGIHHLKVQPDLASSDAGEIEQVANRTGLCLNISADDADSHRMRLGHVGHGFEVADRGDGCERRAQFVGQHRQELVLRLVVQLSPTPTPHATV